MQKIIMPFGALLLFIAIQSFTSAQTNNDLEKIWSIIKPDPFNTININPDYRWVPEELKIKYYDFDGTVVTVGPNFRPLGGTNSTQSEISIDVHPINSNIIFGSANTTNWPFTTIYGTGVYWSSDGGDSWTGFNSPPFGTNRGDPVSVIGTNGYMYEGYISTSSGQGVSVSSNGGSSWSSYTVTPNPGTLADKNHMMVDKKVGSPYENRVYAGWTDFGGTNNNNIVIKYSTNFGQTWSTGVNISSSLNAGSHNQGVNIQTGPNGEVYAAWAVYDNWASGVYGEDAIGFAKSTDGGVTWTAGRIYSASNFGIRGNIKPTSIRVSSFPSMAVDRSGGSTNGYIYITWPQKGVSPAGNDPDIVMIRSTNGGTTWSSLVRVNNDPISNGKDQYYPWMTVDQSTGDLHFVFYDSRETINDSAGVYMARSSDGGLTFENYKVSDHNFKPKPITGLASGYQGDYIGIAALDNIVYPFWSDDRTGNYQGWMSKVVFGPPCPIEEASNPGPINGLNNISVNLSNLSWTNGTGASQCEVWFGEGSNMNIVYTGSLIVSWDIPFTLNYNTVYKWQIVGKNDTCSVPGPVWSFKTELSPGVLFLEPFENTDSWSPIGPLGTTNWTVQNSTNAGGTSPELRFGWSPQFNGLSKFVSDPILVNNNNHYTLKLRHMLDWYAATAPYLGVGVSYNNGATYTSIWEIHPTGNINADTVSVSFLTPPSNSADGTNLSLVLYCNGSSYNIDYWYVDDVILIDDDFTSTFPLTVDVNGGWNMVSIPGLQATNQLVTTWWPGRDPAASVFKYSGGYQSVDTLKTGLGYWMKNLTTQTYNTGDEWPAGGIQIVTHDPIAGAMGWNLIGGYENFVPVANITTTPSGLILGTVFGYSTNYQPADTLKPGYGYWIKLSAAGQINMPSSILKGTSKIAELINKDWGKIVITDNTGKSFTLYAINGKVNLNDLELPPVPPAGMFDVRYGSGRYAEDLNTIQTIEMSGMEYPVKIRVENTSIRLKEENGNGINLFMKAGEEISISNSLINKLSVSGETIPVEYSLDQNYPNPFNPTTQIRYSIPKAGLVTLKVYNTIGEEIVTLVNEQKEAGRYTIQFNSNGFASGVYLYKITSGDFVQTKKMILIK